MSPDSELLGFWRQTEIEFQGGVVFLGHRIRVPRGRVGVRRGGGVLRVQSFLSQTVSSIYMYVCKTHNNVDCYQYLDFKTTILIFLPSHG